MIFLFLMFLLSIISPCFAGTENLDEVLARKARQGTNTYYTGETGAYYLWQPQTLSYVDSVTGNEVWKLTNTPSVASYVHNDLALYPFSANGKRIIYFQTMSDALLVSTSAYTDENENRSILHVRTDGTKLRPVLNGAARRDYHVMWTPWSQSEPDVYFSFGRTACGNSEVINTHLYKTTILDDTESRADILTFPGSNEMVVLLGGISPDGVKILAQEYYLDPANYYFYPATVKGSVALDDADGYPINIPHDENYWGDTPVTITTIHSKGAHIRLRQDGLYWYNILPSGYHTHWRAKLTGSHANGGPDHTIDHTSPYDFGEVVPDNCAYSGNDPWTTNKYWSHTAIDQWGKYVVFSDVDASPIGPVVENTETHLIAYETFGTNGTQHQDWLAFSDWFTNSRGPDAESNYLEDRLFTAKYNDNTSTQTICYTHTLYNNGGIYAYEYQAIPRPTQSPDGTKVLWHSTFLKLKTGDYDDKPDIYYGSSPKVVGKN